MLKQRKSVRLRGYDYSQNGAYFITICTKNREWLFGNVGAGFARPNLSWQGKIVETLIHQISEKYPTAIVEHSVIMPNHVHMILLLSKQGRADPGRADPAPTVGTVMGWFKFMTTKNIDSPIPIWQRSYYDHIIRSEQDYLRIAEYIQNNPLQWEMDCHNPLSNKYKNWSDHTI